MNRRKLKHFSALSVWMVLFWWKGNALMVNSIYKIVYNLKMELMLLLVLSVKMDILLFQIEIPSLIKENVGG